MDKSRLESILEGFDRVRVLVVGDFFLDKYLVLDSSLTERSLETGLDAYQVVENRRSPGAAGTVSSNLSALGLASMLGLGMLGDDGDGYELRAGLKRIGADTSLMVTAADRFTPTYIKPMLREGLIERELNRMDVKNRSLCPEEVEQAIIGRLQKTISAVDAVVIADQVQERNCGVVTDRVRHTLSELARANPQVLFLADSRNRIEEYPECCVKPNRHELWSACGHSDAPPENPSDLAALAIQWRIPGGRPTFVTLAEKGVLALDDAGAYHVPTLRQTGPIDICGAGDTTMAAITLALCSGATAVEAAVIGNICASITVQQIGVTGVASRDQVLRRFEEEKEQFVPVFIGDPWVMSQPARGNGKS